VEDVISKLSEPHKLSLPFPHKVVLWAASLTKLSPVATRIDLEFKSQSDNVFLTQGQCGGVSLTKAFYNFQRRVQLRPSCTYFNHYKAENVTSVPD